MVSFTSGYPTHGIGHRLSTAEGERAEPRIKLTGVELWRNRCYKSSAQKDYPASIEGMGRTRCTFAAARCGPTMSARRWQLSLPTQSSARAMETLSVNWAP